MAQTGILISYFWPVLDSRNHPLDPPMLEPPMPDLPMLGLPMLEYLYAEQVFYLRAAHCPIALRHCENHLTGSALYP